MEAITTSLLTQMGEMGTALTSVMTGTLPIALPLIGGVFVIVKGISVFKKVTNKA